MKNIIWLILVIAILVAIAVLVGRYSSTPKVENDTTTAINQDLESLNFGDLETEFQAIDSALDQL